MQSDRGIKINLACGEDVRSGYINVDLCVFYYGLKGENIVQANSFYLPFKDDCADEILLSHFLEHLRGQEIIDTLLECKRVVKPSGNLIIVVPDMDVIARKWVVSDVISQAGWWTQALFGSTNGPQNAHKSPLNEDILTFILRECGMYIETSSHDKTWDFWLIVVARKA